MGLNHTVAATCIEVNYLDQRVVGQRCQMTAEEPSGWTPPDFEVTKPA